MSLRALRVSSLGVIVAASCASRTAAPPQPPTPPPQAFPHPGFVYYGSGQSVPQPTPLPPARNVPDPVNLRHLIEAAAQPNRCNLPFEVAPNQFVHLDCFPYARISIAQVHATSLKLNLMRLGKIVWSPFARPVGAGAGAAPPGLPGLGALAGAFGVGAVAAPTGSYPDMVDHRLSGTEGPVKDQGDVGACTAFALSTVMDNSLRRAGQNITTSPEHLWSHYGVPTMEDAASSNMNKGITTFAALPYSGKEACQIMKDTSDDCGLAYGVRPNTAASDGTLQAKLRAADSANGHKAVQFEELQSPPNLDEIIATLASGADLWTAFEINSSAFTNRRITNGVISDWAYPDGGHALAMVGYRKVNGSYQFLLHNSWGVSWGDQGYAWVNQAMVTRWLHLAYKVKTDIDPGTPASPVVPKTDEDCAGDQVLDAATTRCVGICADLSRPTNGVCANGQPPARQPLGLPSLPGLFPGFPGIPGWNPGPPGPNQPNPPNQPNQPGTLPSAPSGRPAWPWPMPSTLPTFLPPQLPRR